jgi:hypothetical protein
MKYFRINIYLKFEIYLFAFFLIKNKFEKKYVVLSSQCRKGFLQILEFLKKIRINILI